VIYDHSYLKIPAECLRKHYYKHILRLDLIDADTTRLDVGTVMHKGLEILYSHTDWRTDVVDAAVHTALEKYAELCLRPWGDFEHLTEGHIESIIRGYVRSWGGREPYTVVAGAEEPLTMTLPSGLQVGGIVDVVIEDGDALLVMDHKTSGGWLGSMMYNRAKYEMQLRLYCALVEHNYGRPCRGGIINAIYTGKQASNPNSKAKKFDRYRFDYTPGQIGEALGWAQNWERLLYDLEHLSLDETPIDDFPQFGGTHCGWCDFNQLCSAAPAVREGLIELKYEVREKKDSLLASGVV